MSESGGATGASGDAGSVSFVSDGLVTAALQQLSSQLEGTPLGKWLGMSFDSRAQNESLAAFAFQSFVE